MSNIELFEDERAFGYNQFVEVWIPGYHHFLGCIPGLLRDTNPKDLLVVGCGTGNEIAEFMRLADNWQITGVDPSPDMINQARERLKDNEHVRLIEGLVSDISPKDKYGAATLLLVLHFLEDNGDKLALLKDISERLLPGALLVMLDITGDKIHIQQNLQILRLLLPEGLAEEQIHKRLHRIANELHAVSEERLIALCIEAGFEMPIRFFQNTIYAGWLMRKKDLEKGS